jgi:hypothetical protein
VRLRGCRNKAAPDVIESFSNLHGWLRSEQTLELVRAWRHSHFEAARQTLVRAEGCRRSTFVQLNNNTPYTLRRATCALKHGVWLVSPVPLLPGFPCYCRCCLLPLRPYILAAARRMHVSSASNRRVSCSPRVCSVREYSVLVPPQVMPPEFIVPGRETPLFEPFIYKCIILPRQARDKDRETLKKGWRFSSGEQGVPFGSGFQIGPQATEANSSEQATSSFIVGTKGIVAYTAFIEEGDQMVLLEVDCTQPTTQAHAHAHRARARARARALPSHIVYQPLRHACSA